MDGGLFFDLVEAKYRYLIDDYAFRLRRKRAFSGWAEVLYRNRTTAVKIWWEYRDSYFEVSLSRLVDGKLLDDPWFILPDSVLNTFYLSNLVAIRCPDRKTLPKLIGTPFTDGDIEELMSAQSSALREWADDVLRGDFSVFPQLDAVVKARLPERDADLLGRTVPDEED